jgi:hypothetical protein
VGGDEVLVRLALGGDRAAFGALVTPHVADLTRLCRRIAGPALADDCVQDMLLLAQLRLQQVFPDISRGHQCRVHYVAGGYRAKDPLMASLSDCNYAEQHEEWQVARRYFSAESLAELTPAEEVQPVALGASS